MLSFASPYLEAVDQTMRQIVKSSLPDEEGFGVMIRYALGWSTAEDRPYEQPAGKRLRPLLLLLCAGESWQRALPAAVAVELLHNFSLIHDDIQDQSIVRHNRPTVWQVWGIANAINAGDAMFTLAYAALASLSSTLEAVPLLKLWHIFNATNLELTRGQHLDMRFESQTNVPSEAYISMIRGKSAALLAASAQIGALVGYADEQRASHFATFGLNVGIAFQIHDDILGIWGDPQVTGKSAATDLISRKKSLPVLHGLEHQPEFAAIYHQPNELSSDNLKRAVALLDQCGAREAALQAEAHYYELAMRALELAQPDGQSAGYLSQLLAFLFRRDY
ncbi:MAG: polyprenyl synthetase family protein [Anaerolineae bacterium]|nr:polyprenyl synthetase family protein [Anaerolineae bacterium]